MGGRRDEDAGPRRPARTTPQPSARSTATLVAGFLLAGIAVLAIFLTDDPTYLRLAVIAAAASFVLVAVAAARRGADQTAAAAREAELRLAFERELDREEAAHREIELQLENDLRREAQEAVRYELDALRREIAALSSMRGDVRGISVLREQLAALPALRDELARISALRAEVAALNALRDDVEALAGLREDFGQMGELRAEVRRLRTEITEQLSSELLIERIVMRTQGRWSAGEPGPGSAEERPADELDRTSPPPAELTGGWPPIGPATSAMPLLVDPATDLVGHHSRHSAAPDDDGAPPATAEVMAITAERPRPQPFPRYARSLPPNDNARRPASGADDATADPLPRQTRPPAPVVHDPAPTGPVYVSDILAEQGTPPPGSRRRRRYRDENTEDDVLSRVLGRD